MLDKIASEQPQPDEEAKNRELMARFGVVPDCARCKFGFPVRLNVRDVGIECREGPPMPVHVVLPDRQGQVGGMNLRAGAYVPRIVSAGHFCGRFQVLPGAAHG